MGKGKISEEPEVTQGFDAKPLTEQEKQAAIELQLEREKAEQEKEKLDKVAIHEAADSDGFEAVDTGAFDFEELAVGSVFIGEYLEEWTSEEDGGKDKANGFVFKGLDGRRKVLPKLWALNDFFVNKSGKNVDYSKPFLTKITVVKQLEGSGTKKGAFILDFAVKYLS